MDVIINNSLNEIPLNATPIPGQENPLLHLLYCLGYPEPHRYLPALLTQFHHLQGSWAILLPIHWQATHNDVRIQAFGEQLPLTPDESKVWFQLLSDFLAQDGITLHYHDANFWLISTTNLPPVTSGASPSAMKNCAMLPELETLDNTLQWQKLLTEVQMLFSHQTINHQREKEGKHPVNGLWVIGADTIWPEHKKLKVCLPKEFLPLAALCVTKPTAYSPTLDLQQFDVVLLNEFTTLPEKQQQQLEQAGQRWFWNTTAYQTPKPSFLRSIWRFITHAH